MHVIKSATFCRRARWTSAIDSDRITSSELIVGHAIAGLSGSGGAITFSSNLFPRATDSRHCCIYAAPRASIQARRRVHKTILQPLHGSLARSQTTFHASFRRASIPAKFAFSPTSVRSQPSAPARPSKPRRNPSIRSLPPYLSPPPARIL